MNDELIKLIDAEKEVLSTLPKNNVKNKKKYVEALDKDIEEYSVSLSQAKEEIIRRDKIICDKVSPAKDLESLKEKVSLIKSKLYLFNDYNSSYEKMKFDKILFNLSLESKTLEDVNNDILVLINKFKEAGIELKEDSFKYSPMVYEYMKDFLKCSNDLNNSDLKEKFEKLYWKFPDIITHMEIVFKNLYYKNIKVFDKYLVLEKNKVINSFEEDVVDLYKKEKINLDLIDRYNIFDLVNLFKNKELNPDDYSKVKIDQLLSGFINTDNISDDCYNDSIVNLSKLYNTTVEYQDYLKYLYIIDDMRKIYADKDKYKDVVKLKMKDVVKEEKKLLKLVKKFYPLQLKNKKIELIDKLSMDINNQIMIVKGLYDSLEDDKFNEIVRTLNENSEISSMLSIANSFYIYQTKCLKSVNEEASTSLIEDSIVSLEEFLYSPYNTLINNINIGDDKDIKLIISERYKLANIIISTDQLEDESSLETIQNNIEKIFIFDSISKSVVELDEIDFIYKVSNLLKNKESN